MDASITNTDKFVRDSEEGIGENWRTYSQESTLHGIKYIGKEGVTIHRK